MAGRIIILVVSIAMVACSSGSIPSSSNETYKEDLSALRPTIGSVSDSSLSVDATDPEDNIDYSKLSPTYDVTVELNTVLDSIVKLREGIKYVDGFTVLVYSGTNSEQARIAKGKIYSILPNARPALKFDEPNFRVKVGKYYTRLEAQKDYSAIKRRFSKAIIIPERIYIN